MKLFIQTRGKKIDYSFLSYAPQSRWWLNFQDYTSFEKPSFILKANASDWSCYLSGITSARKDRVGSVIRYSIVLEGNTENAESLQLIKNLIAWWILQVANKPDSVAYQCPFDLFFTEEMVESFLAERNKTLELQICIEQLVLSSLATLPVWKSEPETATVKDQSEPPFNASSWHGNIDSKLDCDMFLDVCHALLTGGLEGQAVVLNMAETNSEAYELMAEHNSIFILIKEPVKKNLMKSPLPIKQNETPQKILPRYFGYTALCIIGILVLLYFWPSGQSINANHLTNSSGNTKPSLALEPSSSASASSTSSASKPASVASTMSTPSN